MRRNDITSESKLAPVIEKILFDARLYPSADNTQSFWFSTAASDQVSIHRDEAASSHPLDLDGASSWITLGHLLESIRLEASVVNFEIETTLHTVKDGSYDSAPKVATLNFKPNASEPTERDSMLQRCLRDRTTDRRGFSQKLLSSSEVNTLQTLVQLPVGLKIWAGVPHCFKDYALKLESALWSWTTFGQATLRWVQLSRNVEVGLNPRNLGISRLFLPSTLLMRYSSYFYRLVVRFGGTRLNRQILKSQLDHSAWLGVYTLPAASPENFVELGRSNLRVWTWLCGNGFGFQPLTASTLPGFHISTDPLPKSWPDSVVAVVSLRAGAFGSLIENSDDVIWGFRSGGATPLPMKMRTGRKKQIYVNRFDFRP
ncbi:hypothetical protein BH10BDE1_BH10BDE1_24370 [soil metagenome]